LKSSDRGFLTGSQLFRTLHAAIAKLLTHFTPRLCPTFSVR